MDQPNKLKLPEGVSPLGPVESITDAYLKALLSLPELLADISQALDDLDNTLYPLSLYFMRKGKDEGIISEDDFEKEGSNESGKKD